MLYIAYEHSCQYGTFNTLLDGGSALFLFILFPWLHPHPFVRLLPNCSTRLPFHGAIPEYFGGIIYHTAFAASRQCENWSRLNSRATANAWYGIILVLFRIRVGLPFARVATLVFWHCLGPDQVKKTGWYFRRSVEEKQALLALLLP